VCKVINLSSLLQVFEIKLVFYYRPSSRQDLRFKDLQVFTKNIQIQASKAVTRSPSLSIWMRDLELVVKLDSIEPGGHVRGVPVRGYVADQEDCHCPFIKLVG
jgi:hypothetical protein